MKPWLGNLSTSLFACGWRPNVCVLHSDLCSLQGWRLTLADRCAASRFSRRASRRPSLRSSCWGASNPRRVPPATSGSPHPALRPPRPAWRSERSCSCRKDPGAAWRRDWQGSSAAGCHRESGRTGWSLCGTARGSLVGEASRWRGPQCHRSSSGASVAGIRALFVRSLREKGEGEREKCNRIISSLRAPTRLLMSKNRAESVGRQGNRGARSGQQQRRTMNSFCC